MSYAGIDRSIVMESEHLRGLDTTEGQRRLAGRYVAGRALDVEDARELLAVLGLEAGEAR